jgi:hypothetical protein
MVFSGYQFLGRGAIGEDNSTALPFFGKIMHNRKIIRNEKCQKLK